MAEKHEDAESLRGAETQASPALLPLSLNQPRLARMTPGVPGVGGGGGPWKESGRF